MRGTKGHNKRICHIAHSYFPKDSRILNLSKSLENAGYAIDIVCLRDIGELKFEQYSENIKVYRLNSKKKRGSNIRYLFEFILICLLGFIKVSALSFQQKYTIIHVNNIPNFLVFSTLFARLRGSKILLDMHELMPELFLHRNGKKGFFHKILQFEEKVSVMYASKVMTVTKNAASILSERNRGIDIPVVMNTHTDISKISRKVLENRNKEECFRIIFHGTLTSSYNLFQVIDALKLLNENGKLVSFDIFGDGKTLALIQSYLKETNSEDIVKLKGWQSMQLIFSEMNNYDAAIVPPSDNITAQFGYASKISHYILKGIPIICSDIQGIKSYFDNNAIVYFAPGDVADLSEKINHLIEHYKINAKSLTQNASQQFETINWNIMSNRYLEIIKTLEK